MFEPRIWQHTPRLSCLSPLDAVINPIADESLSIVWEKSAKGTAATLSVDSKIYHYFVYPLTANVPCSKRMYVGNSRICLDPPVKQTVPFPRAAEPRERTAHTLSRNQRDALKESRSKVQPSGEGVMSENYQVRRFGGRDPA